jgi:hypothetical protein
MNQHYWDSIELYAFAGHQNQMPCRLHKVAQSPILGSILMHYYEGATSLPTM